VAGKNKGAEVAKVAQTAIAAKAAEQIKAAKSGNLEH